MSERIRTIVVAVAGGEAADPALRPAVRLAKRLGATLHAVHAFEFPAPVLQAYEDLGLTEDSVGADYAQRMEELVVDQARQIDPEVEVHARAALGPADEVLSREAAERQADLVVVGSTHRGKVGRAVLGTTAERIIRAAERPVLVIRRGKEVSLDRALVTTDLSEQAGRTVDRALEVLDGLTGEDHPVELRCLYTAWHGATLPPPIRQSYIREAVAGDMTSFIEARGRPMEGTVRVGIAADEIVREARDWDADLVVVGTHRRQGLGRLFLGSVAAGVVRDAPCHALVVPAGAGAPAEGTGQERSTAEAVA